MAKKIVVPEEGLKFMETPEDENIKVRMLKVAIGKYGVFDKDRIYEMKKSLAESFIKEGAAVKE